MARKRKFTLALSSELTVAVVAENNSLNDKAASSTLDSSPVPANNLTSAQNQQELSANSLPNDVQINGNHRHIFLSDDDEDLSSFVSVVTLLNNNNNSGQDCLRVQALFRNLLASSPQSVLELAINIRNGLMNRIGTDGTTLTLTTLQHSNVLPQQSLPGISQHTKNQLQEEFKALFLQTRNNSTYLYEELIIRMCNISKTDDRLGSLVKNVGSWYNMCHYRLHVAIVKLTTEFLSIYKSLKTDASDVLKAMITREDTQQVIKTCDKITIDLKIPTKPSVVKESLVRKLLS
ncbi:6473_t:CDS:2 [Funneliformis mosseae]|uniref:6473_t:CDS:1 n=1 Tax=Funneliformis mosseae TaxID=27381 RepID=A0A9N9EF34_FUNMO|nr:6473_t:CDS:2 [Funneliformis mosseae]